MGQQTIHTATLACLLFGLFNAACVVDESPLRDADISLINDLGSLDADLQRDRHRASSAWLSMISQNGKDALWAGAITLDASGQLVAVGGYRGTIRVDNTTLSSPKYGHAIFAAKLSSDGTYLWKKTIAVGDTGEIGNSGITADGKGNVFICGTYSTSTAFSLGATSLKPSGEKDVYVAKLNSNGAVAWAVGTSGNQRAHCTDVAYHGGKLYVIGWYYGDLSLGKYKINSGAGVGTKSFTAVLDDAGKALELRSDGGGSQLEVDGTGLLLARGGVLKTDLAGKQVWSKQWPGVYIQKLSPRLDGSLLALGYFYDAVTVGNATHKARGKTDVLVMKLHKSRQVAWSAACGGLEYDWPGAVVAAGQNGDVFIAGETTPDEAFWSPFHAGKKELYGHGWTDVFLASLDKQGRFTWAMLVGDRSMDDLAGMVAGKQGELYLFGRSWGAGTFTFGDLKASKSADSLFLVKHIAGM